MARARMCPGHMVCAETFRLARIWIHATPATNIVTDSTGKLCQRAPAKVVNAKTAVAIETSASVESLRRKNGMEAAPAKAPSAEESQQQPVALRAKGMRQQRQQRRQGAGGDAEDGAAHQHSLHRLRASHVADAVEHGAHHVGGAK